MKKIVFSFFFLASLIVHAQTINIHLRNGESHEYNIDEIEAISFQLYPKGTVNNPYTVAQLLDACVGLEAGALLDNGATIYTRGIVTKITEVSTQYGNTTYYIADTPNGTQKMYVYRGRMLDNSAVTDDNQLCVGDTVVVCGTVTNYRGTTLEYSTGSYLAERHPYVPDAEQLKTTLSRLEFPMSRNDGNSIIVVHQSVLNDLTGEQGINYCLEWDTARKAQRWSCYQMYASLLQRNTSRYQGGYPNDTSLPLAHQFSEDPYWNTGYDHGHICPSADRLASSESNMQTFFLTNMQPQAHAFNAGIWEKMENQVRTWAASFDTLYVCKGGTIDQEAHIDGYLGNGNNRIPIPKYFFMALLGKQLSGNYVALGLWVEHSTDIPADTPIATYAMNIRELEQLTGIDFFHNLPDATEQTVETMSIEAIRNLWF